MPLFNIGDRVERIGALVPTSMREGIVTKVIPQKHGIDWASQYEVDFGEQVSATFYQNELRLIAPAPPEASS